MYIYTHIHYTKTVFKKKKFISTLGTDCRGEICCQLTDHSPFPFHHRCCCLYFFFSSFFFFSFIPNLSLSCILHSYGGTLLQMQKLSPSSSFFLFFFLYNVCFHRGSCLRPCLNVLLLAERIRPALRFPVLR